MLRTSRLAAALAALAALAACSDSPVAPGSATDPVAAESSARAVPEARSYQLSGATSSAVATCAGGTLAVTADEKRSVELHNARRAASGLAALCVDPTLTAAARAHSEEMIARQYFSHGSFGGETFGARLVRFGYTPWRALAENIAYGSGSYGTPDAIFNGWMNSAGHRANILNGNLRQIGVGVALGTFRGYAGVRMYTVDFGTR